MSEWTRSPSKRRTEHGLVYYGGSCRDDYRNMVTYNRDGNFVLTLQRPAMEAFLDAQVRFARLSGWSKQRIESSKVRVGGKVYQEGKPIWILPGTNRTCKTQAALYKDDPNRFASPWVTGHTRGLAIDRHNGQPSIGKVDIALNRAGWKRVRPSDEPWHWSYGYTI
jgi:hypothetical protein